MESEASQMCHFNKQPIPNPHLTKALLSTLIKVVPRDGEAHQVRMPKPLLGLPVFSITRGHKVDISVRIKVPLLSFHF